MASNPVPGTFSKDFSLDSGIFTTASVSLSASTNPTAAAAILANDKFPEGDFQLGQISVTADTGKVAIKPASIGGASVTFDLKASAQSGIGIYAKSADAIKALNLTDPLPLTIPDAAGTRYLLMDWGYTASASGSGSSPIGVFGSATLGVDASADSLFAVLHRFDDTTELAHTVMQDTIGSWRLPSQVAFADGHVNIKPGTWLIAEVDGSLAIKVASSLGWNMSFARDLKLLGVTHDLSAKIDASLSASFGFSVSGKYILAVGRASADPVVRLQVSKQKSNGLNFGLNLAVGLQGSDPQLPASFDDFIKSTFGVQGLQVLNDLRTWTDPTTDLGQKLAGLADQTVLDLLKSTTVIDRATEFDKAKQIVTDALNTWAALPTKLSSMLWTYLGQTAGAANAADFKTFLTDLSNPATAPSALATALQKATFGDTPEGQFLESVADNGLLALSNDLAPVSAAAGQVLSILNGGILAKLQTFINQKLDLSQISAAVAAADPAKVDQWLQNRLGNFLDKQLGLDDLKQIQTAIQTLNTNVKGYYATAVQALTKHYSVSFASTYQSTTTDTALIDVNFDLSVPEAATLYNEVVAQSNLDDLLTVDTKGVTLNQAKLTHEISRKGTVDLNMPWFDFSATSLNDSIATLTAEDQGGRVLLYQVNAKDSVTVANRSASQLSVLASLKVSAGQAPQLASTGSIAYEMLQVKAGMRPADLKALTTTFVHQYLGGLFSGDPSIVAYYASLDNSIKAATGNAADNLGDIALSMQVSLPATLLAAWFQSRGPGELKTDRMVLSRALQAAWKNLLPALFFQDLSQYQFNESIAALLVWSSIPVSTSIDFDEDSGTIRFNTDNDVFWNWPDVDLRRDICRDSHTLATLSARLSDIQSQLTEAGNGNAGFFAPSMAGKFVELALNQTGDILLSSLLFTEAEMVQGATDALKNISAAISTAATAPGKAITTLAQFAADLTNTFNQRVSSVYSGIPGRVVGPLLLVEASRALGGAAVTPSGILTLYALKGGHATDLTAFVTGTLPPKADVALTETLVSVAGA